MNITQDVCLQCKSYIPCLECPYVNRGCAISLNDPNCQPYPGCCCNGNSPCKSISGFQAGCMLFRRLKIARNFVGHKEIINDGDVD